jgi:DNA-binding transcriptional LysR family regulator
MINYEQLHYFWVVAKQGGVARASERLHLTPQTISGQISLWSTALALHRVDMVIADGPIPPGLSVRGFNHALGECGISFLAVPRLAKALRKGFPRSLNGAPLRAARRQWSGTLVKSRNAAVGPLWRPLRARR